MLVVAPSAPQPPLGLGCIDLMVGKQLSDFEISLSGRSRIRALDKRSSPRSDIAYFRHFSFHIQPSRAKALLSDSALPRGANFRLRCSPCPSFRRNGRAHRRAFEVFGKQKIDVFSYSLHFVIAFLERLLQERLRLPCNMPSRRFLQVRLEDGLGDPVENRSLRKCGSRKTVFF